MALWGIALVGNRPASASSILIPRICSYLSFSGGKPPSRPDSSWHSHIFLSAGCPWKSKRHYCDIHPDDLRFHRLTILQKRNEWIEIYYLLYFLDDFRGLQTYFVLFFVDNYLYYWILQKKSNWQKFFVNLLKYVLGHATNKKIRDLKHCTANKSNLYFYTNPNWPMA